MKYQKSIVKSLTTVLTSVLLVACGQQSTINSSQNTASVVSNSVSGVTSLSYEYKTEDLNVSYDDTATKIMLSGASASGEGISVQNGKVTISKSGTYVLSGELTGSLVINVSNTEKVHLVLNGVSVTNNNGPAIQIDQADKVIVTLQDGTTNTLSDGSSYVIASDASKTDGAAVYSKDDLVFNGTGTLKVVGQYKNGVQSKDDLVFVSGNYDITSANDAIKGKDLVVVKNADISITSKGDGIVATNTEDTSKGFVLIEAGSILINSVADGMQSVTATEIVSGKISIKTTGDANTVSAKGIKSDGVVKVSGGSLILDTTDDGLHAKNVQIDGGNLIIDTGDDGIHGDESVTINAGTIDIPQSYEGVESELITINGGDITVVASDDALNAASSTTNGTGMLKITGGNLTVTSNGDGLDANGNVEMSGGTVYIYGPVAGGNGVLDYDGTFKITGGVLVGAGTSSMAQAPSNNSTQVTIATTVSSQAANATLTIKDSANQVIAEVQPTVAYSYIVVSSPEMKVGETYTISVNGNQVSTVTATAVVTGTTGNGFGGRR